MHLSPSKGTGMHAVMFLFCLVSQFRCSLQIKKKTIAVYTSQTSFKCISLSNCIVKVDSTSFREISLTLRLSSYVFLFFFFLRGCFFFCFCFLFCSQRSSYVVEIALCRLHTVRWVPCVANDHFCFPVLTLIVRRLGVFALYDWECV